MPWDLHERMTNHAGDGKFCGSGAAVTVTKDGERYKVVRQHRRMTPSGGKTDVKKHPRKSVAEGAALMRERVSVARARTALRGWVSVDEVIRGMQ